MKLFILIISAMFLILLIVGTQAHSQEQTQPKDKASVVQSEKMKSSYTCPMHPEVTTLKPGKCPKCGMPLVKKLVSKAQSNSESKTEKLGQSTSQLKEKTGTMMVADAKSKLQEAKAKLTKEGKYGCCIKDPCNMCALTHGDCDCYNDLKKGEHVCIECYAGWQQGKGADETIKKENVKTSVVHHEHNH